MGPAATGGGGGDRGRPREVEEGAGRLAAPGTGARSATGGGGVEAGGDLQKRP